MSQIDWKNVEAEVKHICSSPVYIVGITQLADNDW